MTLVSRSNSVLPRLVSIDEPVLHTRISLPYSRRDLLLAVQSRTLFCLLVAVLIE
jgi:hypothetical protein